MSACRITVPVPHAISPGPAETPHVVPGGCERVASTLALQPLLREFGVDLQQLLAQSGLRADLFNNPDNLVPFRHGSRLLGLDRTGCAHLGPLIGRHTPLEALGIVAELVKAAPEARTALNLLSRYLTLSDGGGLAALREDARFQATPMHRMNPVSNALKSSTTSCWHRSGTSFAPCVAAAGCRTRSISCAVGRPTAARTAVSCAHRCASTANRLPWCSTSPGWMCRAQRGPAALEVAGSAGPRHRSPGHGRVACPGAAGASSTAAERRHLDAPGGGGTGDAPAHVGPKAAAARRQVSGDERRGPL